MPLYVEPSCVVKHLTIVRRTDVRGQTQVAFDFQTEHYCIIIIIIILFVHKNNFIKTRQPTTRERDRQG